MISEIVLTYCPFTIASVQGIHQFGGGAFHFDQRTGCGHNCDNLFVLVCLNDDFGNVFHFFAVPKAGSTKFLDKIIHSMDIFLEIIFLLKSKLGE